jgi:L-alanine-DL-glutamate epimerase-like enolase superfamily enzyme
MLNAPVESLQAFHVVVPLPEPLYVFGNLVAERAFIFVRANAAGQMGTGFGLARVAGIEQVIQRHLTPLVVGKPVGSIRQIWNAARRSMRMIGESGVFARALAAVDIALWDLLGKTLNAPIWQLLGGAQRDIPCIAIAGYYRRDDSVGKIRQEAKALVEAGYTGFKIPFGADAELDVQRVRALREVAGKQAMIGLDASGMFDSIKAAQKAWRRVEQHDIAFLEDPFPAPAWKLAIDFAQTTDVPVAFGESVSLPEEIQQLGGAKGVDFVRPDATHQLGVTGYLQGVAPALGHHTPIFPHYFPDLHSPLAGAFGAAFIEESPGQADTVGFRVLRAAQPDLHDSMWRLNDRPGFGIEWDEDALRRLRR